MYWKGTSNEPGHCISEEYEVSAIHVDNMGLGDYDGACETFVLKSLSHWGWIIYWYWQPYH